MILFGPGSLRMSKNRIGLQKNCSEIFEGVWIPSRNRQKENMTEQEKEQQQQKQIEEIIAVMKCSKDFLCYKSGFTNLCEVKVVAETGTGNVSIFGSDVETYTSSNYDSATAKYEFALNTSTGGITVT